MLDRGQVFVKNLGHFWLVRSSHTIEPSTFYVGRSSVVSFLMSNVVTPLLATFDLRLECFPGGAPLYTLEDFYMGSASLKTSPPLGVSPMRKRIQALTCVF
jgi:hypothetical protein